MTCMKLCFAFSSWVGLIQAQMNLPLFPEGHNRSKYITDGTDTRTFNSCRKIASQACNSSGPDYCSDPEKNFPSAARPDCFPPWQCSVCSPGGQYSDGVAYFCAKDATAVLVVVYHGQTNCTKIYYDETNPIREGITPSCSGDDQQACHAHCVVSMVGSSSPACRGRVDECAGTKTQNECESGAAECCEWKTKPDSEIRKTYKYMYVANASGSLLI